MNCASSWLFTKIKAGEILRVVVNWSLGRGVRERYREGERENVGEDIPDFVGWLLVVATIYFKS